MYQRDYILRLIEQTAVSVREVLLNKAGQTLKDRLLVLNQAMKRLMGLDSKLIQALSVQDILVLLSRGGGPDLGKALGVSDILLAQSKVHGQEGLTDEARNDAMKALELLLNVRGLEEGGELKEETDTRIEEALQLLGRSELHEGIWERLAFYYEETGRLDKAEDILFHWLEGLSAQGESERIAYAYSTGSGMYERWMAFNDEKLQAGGLSRDEVKQGESDLRKMKA